MATARKDPTAEAFRRDRTRNLNIQEVRFPANMDMASLTEALRIAKPAVSHGDLICITGSFYLVGEAKQHFEKQAAPI